MLQLVENTFEGVVLIQPSPSSCSCHLVQVVCMQKVLSDPYLPLTDTWLGLLCRPQHVPTRAVLVDLKGLSHASTLELARYMRKKSSLQALPVLALAMNPGTSAEKELKEAGISYIVSKPLRYSTLSAVLLQTIGVQVRAPMKKVNMNAKMLAGRRLLVVIFSVIQGSSSPLSLFPTLSQIAVSKNGLWIAA